MHQIKQLYKITQQLREKHRRWNKQFTLDGKLVGDIGEVLAAEKYGLELYPENSEVYDGVEIASGRKVQIKASFKGYFQFPYGEEKIPDYFLAVLIDEHGELHEVYNGPGRVAYDNYIVKHKLKPYNNSYYSVSKGKLKGLMNQVSKEDMIKERID
ncbi:MAG: hypothetical protein A2W93_00365 [Bacteroidetes bacterium GWF2_43_63]|nr:MAG: hypothetical protein A2W94_13155 [Bacteroidetes bacterium GWE2_42_42]OFY53859.1 MAG: hypothetical protein A2W93_00365 [Bacteroidetes bacterium GWF2_43_63]HBG69817.1 hypothetical protein [Bacteroidales bacterium]HCB60985.1 hypothetical protein [Bacteroidales bacterium]HCY24541.1 hypothetical protein [Bacteroidales bacterium]